MKLNTYYEQERKQSLIWRQRLNRECAICHKIVGDHELEQLEVCNGKLETMRKASLEMHQALLIARPYLCSIPRMDLEKIEMAIAKAEGKAETPV